MNGADYFGLEELRQICTQYSQRCVNVDTACSILCSAERYIHYKATKIFVQKVLDFVAEHGSEILESHDFLTLPRHVLELIIGRDDLHASEVSKYRACERWSQHYCDENPVAMFRAVMAQFMKSIQLCEIPTQILMREIRPLDIVPDHVLLHALAYQADPESVENASEFSRWMRPLARSKSPAGSLADSLNEGNKKDPDENLKMTKSCGDISRLIINPSAANSQRLISVGENPAAADSPRLIINPSAANSQRLINNPSANSPRVVVHKYKL